MTYPTIDYDLDLGVLGKQCARIGYRPDDKDVQFIIVENGALYLELEITTLSDFVQNDILDAIDCDLRERIYAAAEYRRDMEREDGGRA